MTRKLWIAVGAAAVLGVVVAAAAVRARLPEQLVSGHPCTAAAARFSLALSKDPVVTEPPPGFGRIKEPLAVFQPCEGNGDNSYYGGALRGWSIPASGVSAADIERYYRRLGEAHGWQMVQHIAHRLSGHKVIDGTAVTLTAYDLDHPRDDSALWVELRYDSLGSPRFLC